LQGAYAIRHTATGQAYIGMSSRIEHRWSEHRSRLNRGTHHNTALQAAWVEHGAGAFEFVVLEEGTSSALEARWHHENAGNLYESQPAIGRGGARFGAGRRPLSAERLAAMLAQEIARLRVLQARIGAAIEYLENQTR
jgi:hypothetical protein